MRLEKVKQGHEEITAESSQCIFSDEDDDDDVVNVFMDHERVGGE